MRAQFYLLLSASLALAPVRLDATVALTLNRFHPECVATAGAGSGPCLAASHRFCESRYPSTRRAGLIWRREPRLVTVGCVQPAWYGDVAYGDLRAQHNDCDGPSASGSPACVAAAKRFCQSQRQLSGGVIQEVGPVSAAVACLKAATVANPSYRTLAGWARPCNGPSAGGTLACTTAATLACRALDRRFMGIPQEVGPASMTVICVVATDAVLDEPPPVPFDDN